MTVGKLAGRARVQAWVAPVKDLSLPRGEVEVLNLWLPGEAGVSSTPGCLGVRLCGEWWLWGLLGESTLPKLPRRR